MLDVMPDAHVPICDVAMTPTGSARHCAPMLSGIPGRAGRTIPIRHGKMTAPDRDRTKITFGRLKD